MCYRLVDMVATDKTLQEAEFYSEFLKWKVSNTPSSVNGKKRSCSPEIERKNKRRRKLFKSKEKGNTDNLPFLINHNQNEKADEIVPNKSKKSKKKDSPKKIEEPINKNIISPDIVNWQNITDGRKIYDLENARISKASLKDGEEYIRICIKIYKKTPSVTRLNLQANALNSLKGFPGIPQLYGIIAKDVPAAIVMSYHSSKTLREYIEDGDSLMSLLAFSDICKNFEKMHSHSWAHFDIKSSNIVVNIDDKGKIRTTIIDFTFCGPVQSNPYCGLENLPSHIPEDVLNRQCEGDLVDRFSLCYLANEICSKMVDVAETKTLSRAVRRGLLARTLPHARKRPGPLALARMVSKLVGKNTHLSWKYDLDE